jgi:hypothetical protein
MCPMVLRSGGQNQIRGQPMKPEAYRTVKRVPLDTRALFSPAPPCHGGAGRGEEARFFDFSSSFLAGGEAANVYRFKSPRPCPLPAWAGRGSCFLLVRGFRFTPGQTWPPSVAGYSFRCILHSVPVNRYV